MKSFRLLLNLLLFFPFIGLQAQTLSVESFRLLENDLAANTQGTMMRDQNGDVAALIRVVTSEKGFVFDGGMMGIVGTKQDVGEILLYVPHGIQKITIKHDQLGVLRDYYFPIPIEKARTYELKLVSGRVKTIIEEEQTTQFLVLKVDPPTASVYLDGRIQSLMSDGSVSVLTEFGRHEYRVEAAGYITQAGVVEIGREKVTKEIVLKSSKAQLTLHVANEDAEIWLNGEKVGTGQWSGLVNPGKYVAEARLDHHRNRSVTFDIEEQEEKNVSLTPPDPMYGSMQFNSDPVETTVYLDGKEVGTTPMILNNILEGSHEVMFEKKGYHSYETVVVVTEGKRAEVQCSLSDIFTATITSRPEGASLKINGESKGVTPYVAQMSSGDYQILIERFGYKTYDNKVYLDAVDNTLNARLARQFFKPSGFYFAGIMDYIPPLGKNANSGAAVGCFVKNVNVEASFLIGINSEDISVSYISVDADEKIRHVAYNVKSSINLKMGYGFLLGHRMRLTPQAGAKITEFKGDDGSNTFVASATGSLTLEFGLVNHVALYLSPYILVPVSKGEIMEKLMDVSDMASKYGKGAGASVGLSFYF